MHGYTYISYFLLLRALDDDLSPQLHVSAGPSWETHYESEARDQDSEEWEPLPEATGETDFLKDFYVLFSAVMTLKVIIYNNL